jgi:predicted Rossmann fold nucleotide-binding protein DprA/Smf involved in DNA uptake
MKKEEAIYWMTLAHLPRWGYLKINNLVINFYHQYKITIEEFFNLSESEWRNQFKLDEKQVIDLTKAKSELPNYVFLAESLFNQGFEIIPITSPDYSKTLKSNLKAAHTPVIIYIKGNKQILQEKSIAIVGSRNASATALKFTDNIAKLASEEFKVVVSGFAKGVDRQALDSAINYNGQSIIVLPQGIMTFTSGFKTYYKQIIDGNVLVLSTFSPNAPWKTELAMARNPIIYGLADEIYVAESSEKGGTWAGVIDGLRKDRKIFVRKPEPSELNANNILIQKGGIPVDLNGVVLSNNYETKNSEQMLSVNEPSNSDLLQIKIKETLKGRILSAQELLTKLNLPWSTQELNSYLRELDFIEVVKGKNINLYKLKEKTDSSQIPLFV